MRLVVTDAYTGAPLPGAEVVVGGRTETTDHEGRLMLDATDAPAEVAIRSAGYAAAGGQLPPGQTGQLAVALRPSIVEGRLTDAESGAPVSAAVSAPAPGVPGPSARTDAGGRFRLTDVPPNARLRIEAGDYGVVEEPINNRTTIDRALKVTVVTGTVTDAGGAPIAGATVSGPDGAAAATTDAEGRYRLLGADGLAELKVRAPGYVDQTLPIPANRQAAVALEPERIKAIYAPLGVLTDPNRLQRLIEIADTTEANAIVVDVKQDTIYYDTQVPFFREVPDMVRPAFDPQEILATLDEHGIYAIARMVVFKDPVVAEGRPDLAVRDENTGELWRDFNGAAWVNAFNEELWQANADLAVELAGLGFDEIQYDYIRFPSDGDLRTADFGPDYSEEARRAAITGAVSRGAEAVRPTGARFAIDLFPIIAIQGDDQGIGQTLQDLAPLVDSVNLMIYPSHYEEGNIPVDGHPNDFPAETVAYTLERAEELVPGTALKMRPWLQDFDYPLEGFADYGPAEVRAQIDAAEAAGASGWLLWNAVGEFEVEALAPES
ncbi:MAG: carboxypeptidase regulatory-like domain-containing protein [Chloroflexota bacterium]|nr:carboxypeptidase regulatory-like domain-containing protein [Chloroflexota bacterium]